MGTALDSNVPRRCSLHLIRVRHIGQGTPSTEIAKRGRATSFPKRSFVQRAEHVDQEPDVGRARVQVSP